ncbi:hypothetical protein HEP87_53825 [Streptomyces sp. S1D4-11]
MPVQGQADRPSHGLPLPRRQFGPALPRGKLHQALVLRAVDVLLVRREELGVQPCPAG